MNIHLTHFETIVCLFLLTHEHMQHNQKHPNNLYNVCNIVNFLWLEIDLIGIQLWIYVIIASTTWNL
jgi:hypothetical protein